MDSEQRLCVYCRQPIVYWGISKEFRHIGGTKFCSPVYVATPGDVMIKRRWSGSWIKEDLTNDV